MEEKKFANTWNSEIPYYFFFIPSEIKRAKCDANKNINANKSWFCAEQFFFRLGQQNQNRY